MKRKILIVLILMPILLFGQQSVIDSLKVEIENLSGNQKAEVLNKISFQYILLRSIDSASKYSHAAKEYAIQINNKQEEALALKHHGIIHYFQNDFDSALIEYEKSADIFEISKNYDDLIKVLHNISNLYLAKGELPKVLEYLLMSEKYAKANNILSVPLLGSLSNFYQITGDFEKSLHYSLESLKYAEEQGDIEGIAYAYNTLARIYLHNNNLEKAKECYLKSLEQYQKLEQEFHVSSVYNNLGSLYGQLGDYVTALDYCKKSLEIKKNLQYKEGIIFSYLSIGDLYMSLNSFDEASKNYQMGIDLADEKGFDHLLSQLQNRLGILQFHLNKYHVAQQNFIKSNQIALSNNSLEIIRDNLLYLSKIDSIKGNFKSAFIKYQNYKAVNDSIFNQAKIRSIDEMQIRFETVEKEKEIAQLEVDKQLAIKERDFERLFKNMAFIGILVIIVVLILLANRMKMRKKFFEQQAELNKTREEELKNKAMLSELQTEKLQSELHFKNRELTSSALATTQKNEILSQIEERVNELEEKSKPENKDDINYIKRLIKENLNVEKDWEAFKFHFEGVHPDFYNHLKEVHPQLSQNDLKHISYIKVNLSSKEIARIMNISPKSVQMSRYRLKKKFNLGPEDDLSEYIDKKLA